MSVYLKKNKGWRVDFTINGVRHTHAWYKTKTQARLAESQKRKELQTAQSTKTQTDMGFEALVNLKLDNISDHNSQHYYLDFHCLAKRWWRQWGIIEL